MIDNDAIAGIIVVTPFAKRTSGLHYRNKRQQIHEENPLFTVKNMQRTSIGILSYICKVFTVLLKAANQINTPVGMVAP